MTYSDTKSSLPGLIAVIAAACMLSAAPMEGATIIFDQVTNAGSITYDGLGGALVGTDIVFESIQGVGTDNDQTIDCSGCLLNFTTGANTSDAGGSYTFAGGGSFTVTGGSILGGVAGGSTLVDGTWNSGVKVQIIGNGIMILTGTGEDVKDADLLDFFFNNPPLAFRFVDSTIQIESAPGGVVVGPGTAFTADLSLGGNADLVNSSVPLPGTTALFLLGLGGLAAYRRRRN